jgi:tetrahydromethanopterin S-methyltransferase subunit C
VITGDFWLDHLLFIVVCLILLRFNAPLLRFIRDDNYQHGEKHAMAFMSTWIIISMIPVLNVLGLIVAVIITIITFLTFNTVARKVLGGIHKFFMGKDDE